MLYFCVVVFWATFFADELQCQPRWGRLDASSLARNCVDGCQRLAKRRFRDDWKSQSLKESHQNCGGSYLKRQQIKSKISKSCAFFCYNLPVIVFEGESTVEGMIHGTNSSCNFGLSASSPDLRQGKALDWMASSSLWTSSSKKALLDCPPVNDIRQIL